MSQKTMYDLKAELLERFANLEFKFDNTLKSRYDCILVSGGTQQEVDACMNLYFALTNYELDDCLECACDDLVEFKSVQEIPRDRLLKAFAVSGDPDNECKLTHKESLGTIVANIRSLASTHFPKSSL